MMESFLWAFPEKALHIIKISPHERLPCHSNCSISPVRRSAGSVKTILCNLSSLWGMMYVSYSHSSENSIYLPAARSALMTNSNQNSRRWYIFLIHMKFPSIFAESYITEG